MDPITLAIVSAVAAGATAGTTDVGKNLLVDAYTALKNALKAKLGLDSKVIKAVDELEEEPESAAQQAVLKERVAKAQLANDPQLVALANKVRELVETQPGGQTIVQQTIIGDKNIQASNSTVTVSHGDGGKRG